MDDFLLEEKGLGDFFGLSLVTRGIVLPCAFKKEEIISETNDYLGSRFWSKKKEPIERLFYDDDDDDFGCLVFSRNVELGLGRNF